MAKNSKNARKRRRDRARREALEFEMGYVGPEALTNDETEQVEEISRQVTVSPDRMLDEIENNEEETKSEESRTKLVVRK